MASNSRCTVIKLLSCKTIIYCERVTSGLVGAHCVRFSYEQPARKEDTMIRVEFDHEKIEKLHKSKSTILTYNFNISNRR